MHPDVATNLFWENLLAENPSKHKKAKKASRIILQLNIKNQPILSDTEISDMWKDLDRRLSKDNQVKSIDKNNRIIPLHSISTLDKPNNQVLLSGKFQEETLENVLEGLRFSARFDFEIDKENVKIIFKKQ